MISTSPSSTLQRKQYKLHLIISRSFPSLKIIGAAASIQERKVSNHLPKSLKNETSRFGLPDWEITAMDRIKVRAKGLKERLPERQCRSQTEGKLGCVTRSRHKQLLRVSCATFVTGHAKEMLGSWRICEWATDSWKTHPPHMGS